MANRLDAQSYLQAKFPDHTVYYQKPENTKMEYPAIVYDETRVNRRFASNIVYNASISYNVVFLSKSKKPEIIELLKNERLFVFRSTYEQNGLFHIAFTFTP